jgi:hypothetical protein
MKLNQLLTIALVLCSGLWAKAQDNQNEYRSVFNKRSDQKVTHGGYGAFGVGYSSIDSKDAILLNFKGAWVINHNIALGFAGTGFFNNLDKYATNNDSFLGGGYGGFYFEPIILAKSPVHLTFPVLIGGGGVSTIPPNYWDWNWDTFYYQNDYDIFFVVEPGVELEVSMVKFFRMALGASYRFTNGIIVNDTLGEPIAKDALDGFSFYLNFKFGKF